MVPGQGFTAAFIIDKLVSKNAAIIETKTLFNDFCEKVILRAIMKGTRERIYVDIIAPPKCDYFNYPERLPMFVPADNPDCKEWLSNDIQAAVSVGDSIPIYFKVYNEVHTSISFIFATFPPAISSNDELYFNQINIKKRILDLHAEMNRSFNNEMITFDPNVQVPLYPPPACYHILCRILKDRVEHTSRPIRRINNKVSIAIHSDILLRSGFTLNEDDQWIPPNDTDERYDLLCKQLLYDSTVLCLKTSNQFNLNLDYSCLYNPIESAHNFLITYFKCPLPTTQENYSETALGYFTDLGVPCYFPENYIKLAYQIQLVLAPAGMPEFFYAFVEIAKIKCSELLQLYALEQKSLGYYTSLERTNACHALGITEAQMNNFSEEQLIEIYQHKFSSVPLGARAHLKQSFKLIADAKKSNLIQEFLSIGTISPQAAYKTLDLNYSYLAGLEDEELRCNTIVSSYEHKLRMQPSRKGVLDNCLKIIAESMACFPLLDYLEENVLPPSEESEATAYTKLGVSATMDDANIITIFQIRVDDSPTFLSEMRISLRVLAKARKSKLIKYFLRTGSMETAIELSSPEISKWPVGIRNIGNTCYLNSLLQFYFTIKPLRNLILNYDADLMLQETPGFEENFNRIFEKRIGGRIVSPNEIARSKHFMHHLGNLFRRMIKSRDRAVEPDKELVYFALVDPRNDVIASSSKANQPNQRNVSTSVVELPTCDSINGSLTSSRSNSLSEFSCDYNYEAGVLTNNNTAKKHRNSSSSTLVNNCFEDSRISLVTDEQLNKNQLDSSTPPPEMGWQIGHNNNYRKSLDGFTTLDKINTSHIEDVSSANLSVPGSNIKTGKVGSMGPPTIYAKASNLINSENSSPSFHASLPPAYDPFPFDPHFPIKIDFEASLEIGRQQDVTECIQNVLFQIESAVKPSTIESDGEQFDIIKDLFFGTTKQTIDSGPPRNRKAVMASLKNKRIKIERFSHLIVDMAQGPMDLYSCLDSYFDPEIIRIDGGSARKFMSIQKMPIILQIHFQRVQFDKVRGIPYKTTFPLTFYPLIYLDRYMDTSFPEFIEKKEAIWKAKQDLNALREELDNLSCKLLKQRLLSANRAAAKLKVEKILEASKNWSAKMRKEYIDNINFQNGIKPPPGFQYLPSQPSRINRVMKAKGKRKLNAKSRQNRSTGSSAKSSKKSNAKTKSGEISFDDDDVTEEEILRLAKDVHVSQECFAQMSAPPILDDDEIQVDNNNEGGYFEHMRVALEMDKKPAKGEPEKDLKWYIENNKTVDDFLVKMKSLVDDAFLDDLEAEEDFIRMREENLKVHIKKMEIRLQEEMNKVNLEQHPYRLHAVFVHRGQASFGHYWVYIYDFQNNIFRMYNDETVTEVSAEEVFNNSPSNTATPYFMTYIRADKTDVIAESIYREPR